MSGTASFDRQTAAQAARRLLASWEPSAFALAAASVVVMSALVAAAYPLPASSAGLLVIAVPTFLAPLFSPRAFDPRRVLRVDVLAWMLCVLVLWSLCSIAFGVHLAPVRLGLAGLVGLGILVVAHQATSVIEAVLHEMRVDASTARECSVWSVTAILWLTGSTPLWLGPLADLGARVEPMAPTFVLACSPLAHLAAAAGHDLLRGEWFYGHSSLGSLQVEYPRVETLLVAYALFAAALALLRAAVRRRSVSPAGGVSSISPLERYS